MTADTAQGTLLTSVNHVLGEEGQIHGPDITDSLGTPASSVFSLWSHPEKEDPPWQLECAHGRTQTIGSETPNTGFRPRQEEGLGFCLGFLIGNCVVSILAFDV